VKPFPIAILALVSAAYLAVLGWGWIPQAPSNEELPAYVGKMNHLAEMIADERGIPWWSSGYLGGHSFLGMVSYIASVPVYLLADLFLPGATAFKVGGLVLLWLGCLSTYLFVGRWYRNPWAGLIGGLFFLTAAQPLLRLGWVEHLTIVGTYPFVPLCFYFLIRVADEGRPRDAVLLGLSWSATMLGASKIGATVAFGLFVLSLILFLSRSRTRPTLARGFPWAAGTAFLTGVLPLLPLLREFRFMTIFEGDPFQGWQQNFSVKAGTAWFDWGNELLANSPSYLHTEQGGYYLGAVGILAVFLAIYLNWHVRAETDSVVWNLRPILATGLVLFWLSFGPRSVLAGHFEFLRMAQGLPHFVILLHWLGLLGQCLLIWWLTPAVRPRAVLYVVSLAVYLLLPGFRLVEMIPGFGNLRAPDSFWILAGTMMWVAAAAGAVTHLLSRIPKPSLQGVAGTVVVLLLFADSAGSARRFFEGGLPRDLYADLGPAVEFLRKSRAPGKILALSSRYFYLMLPFETGRGLLSEAAHHNFMLKGMARLEKVSQSSRSTYAQFLRTTGVTFLFLDLTDPSLPEDLKESLRENFDSVFVNDHFEILQNPESLASAWIARESTYIDSTRLQDYERALTLAALNVLAVLPAPEPLDQQESVHAMPRQEEKQGRQPFRALPSGNRSDLGNGRIRVDLTQIDALNPEQLDAAEVPTLVVTEAWHPDWNVYGSDGTPFPTLNCLGGLLGTPTSRLVDYIEFRFQPPLWYDAALYGSLGAWVILLGVCALSLPPTIGRRMPGFTTPRPLREKLRENPIERRPIVHTLVVVPTYNEVDNIGRVLDQILEVGTGIQILVVDDGSPDGTADVVRKRPDFDERVRLMERPGKQGLGSAYLAGFNQGIQAGFDALVQIDADLSHNPADIRRLIQVLNEGADVAVGSRYLGGVRVINWSQDRLLLSTGASWYVRLLTGLPLTDATSGFKAIRRTALKELDWSRFRAEGYGFQVELHYYLWRAGAIIREVPIVFTERRGGETKMSRQIAIEAAWRVVQLGVETLFPRDEE